MIGAVLCFVSGVFVHFEPSRRQDRFQVPDFSGRKHPGQGVFNVLCRTCPGEAEVDLWFQASHILVDGNPVLEMLDALKRDWGTAGPVTVPAPSEACWTPVASASSDRGPRQAIGAYQFLCFERLLSIRGELSRKYADRVGEITLASLVVWDWPNIPRSGT